MNSLSGWASLACAAIAYVILLFVLPALPRLTIFNVDRLIAMQTIIFFSALSVLSGLYFLARRPELIQTTAGLVFTICVSLATIAAFPLLMI